MGVGIRGMLLNRGATRPFFLIRLLVGLDLVHDLVLAPVVLVMGWTLSRVVPARLRAPLQGGLFCTAVVVAIAYPFVRGFGRIATNPSALSRNYAHGLLVTLAVVWAVTAAAMVRSWRRGAGRSQAR